jgi:hypothetical protein
MKINDRMAWSDFTYNLLYPGILGSMLYDLIEGFRHPSFDWFLITRITLVSLYVLDYLHAYFDLGENRTQKRALSIAIDAALPLLFGYSYWSMTREGLRATGICLFIASVIIFLYPTPKELGGPSYLVGKILFVVATVVLIAVTFQHAKYGGWPACWAVLATMTIYALHVFVFTEFAKRYRTMKGIA